MQEGNTMQLDLGNLNVAELRELAKNIHLEIEKRESNNKKIVFEQIKELAQKAGMTVEEVVAMGRKARPKSLKSAEAKYVNPQNPAQTWSGKGRRPTWLKDLLATGKSLEGIQAR
jgi:DNA-binding protein H-NS